MNPNPLPNDTIADENGNIRPGWRNFFSFVFTVCSNQIQSGTTAQRPTKLLYPGRPYFDTSLGANGRPIWVRADSTAWVYADGTAA